jgi:histidinol-phosphate aminotransferase
MRTPALTPLAQSLPDTVPFVGPETQERARGRAFKARLGANENLFGPSPSAVAAMANAAADIWMYGDPENHDLRHALAVHHGVAAENIVVGEGIDALLGNLVRLMVGPGDRVVTSEGAYPTFNFHVAAVGGVVEKVPYKGDHEDPVALVAKARDCGARIIYLANPDNPMGSWHQADVIEAMIADLPEDCLMCLDEAYIEMAPKGTAPAFNTDDPRVLRMRTFSKAYGMAGARIGYAIGAVAIVRAFDKLRNHFGVSRIAQAGALAALADQDWLAKVLENIAGAKQRIAEIGQANGLIALPSATNFVTLDCGADGARARALVASLAAQDVFVRMPFAAPQNRCIRISAGGDAELDHLAAVLPAAFRTLES